MTARETISARPRVWGAPEIVYDDEGGRPTVPAGFDAIRQLRDETWPHPRVCDSQRSSWGPGRRADRSAAQIGVACHRRRGTAALLVAMRPGMDRAIGITRTIVFAPPAGRLGAAGWRQRYRQSTSPPAVRARSSPGLARSSRSSVRLAPNGPSSSRGASGIAGRDACPSIGATDREGRRGRGERRSF